MSIAQSAVHRKRFVIPILIPLLSGKELFYGFSYTSVIFSGSATNSGEAAAKTLRTGATVYFGYAILSAS